MNEATRSRRRGSGSIPRLRWAASFGLVVAAGIFILIALVAPDRGPDAASLQQGTAIAAVIAAVPVATIIRPVDASRVVSLGGAMTAAGLGTMFGGNLAGLLMAVSGVGILLVGAYQEPRVSSGLVCRLVAYAVLLILAMWLSLGDTTLAMKTVAVLFSAMVATSSFWDRPQVQSESIGSDPNQTPSRSDARRGASFCSVNEMSVIRPQSLMWRGPWVHGPHRTRGVDSRIGNTYQLQEQSWLE